MTIPDHITKTIPQTPASIAKHAARFMLSLADKVAVVARTLDGDSPSFEVCLHQVVSAIADDELVIEELGDGECIFDWGDLTDGVTDHLPEAH